MIRNTRLWLDNNLALLSNILRPRRRCWENRYKFYKRANERSGGRAQYGGVCDAVWTVSEFSDPIKRVVSPRIGLLNYPDLVTSP